MRSTRLFIFFFFNDTATTEIYTLSLHDALPISGRLHCDDDDEPRRQPLCILSGICSRGHHCVLDRKSTRLNSSHTVISYAVFCLKKKIKYVLLQQGKGADLAGGFDGGGSETAFV